MRLSSALGRSLNSHRVLHSSLTCRRRVRGRGGPMAASGLCWSLGRTRVRQEGEAIHSAEVVRLQPGGPPLRLGGSCGPGSRRRMRPTPSCLVAPVPRAFDLLAGGGTCVESWLIGDRERLSRFLGVAISRIPRNPEAIADPKRAMVDLAARSRRAEIREDMVPRARSGRRQGPAYESRLVEYVSDSEVGWRPDVAASDCESLNRCLHALDRLCRQMEAPEREDERDRRRQDRNQRGFLPG